MDRCLTTLEPFAVNTAFFSLNSTSCLVYRSPFQHGSAVKIHSLDHCGPAYPLHAIAGKSWLWWGRGGYTFDCGGFRGQKGPHDAFVLGGGTHPLLLGFVGISRPWGSSCRHACQMQGLL